MSYSIGLNSILDRRFLVNVFLHTTVPIKDRMENNITAQESCECSLPLMKYLKRCQNSGPLVSLDGEKVALIFNFMRCLLVANVAAQLLRAVGNRWSSRCRNRLQKLLPCANSHLPKKQ